MKRRRVKITGIGPVTPAGIGREEFWKGILEPVSRVRPFTKLGEEFGPFVAAYIDRINVAEMQGLVLPKGIARHTQFAVAGALLALKDAGLTRAALARKGVAVVIGSSLMDFDGIGRTVEGVLAKGIRGALARTVYTTNASVIPATVVQVLELDARTLAIQTSCCAGLDAIGHAYRMVASGEADIALCGGTEAPLFRCPLVELRSTGLTPGTTENAKRLDRPFDLWRTTGVVSEGACMMVLEPDDSPRRGYARIAGYAFANDSGEDLCGGMTLAIRNALADACVNIRAVESINAWGPGHTRIDTAEAKALQVIFGSQLAEIPVFSIKGAIGNPLGAAPAIQIATSALGLDQGILPPTVNWEHPDPACPLNLSGRARALPHATSLVDAHGLAGVNASMLLERC